MAARLHLDFETRSRTELKRAGVHRYAEDQTTGIWLFSYRLDNGPVQRWYPGTPLPAEVDEHIRAGRTVVAHGAMFERTIWNTVLRPRYIPTAPIIVPEQQDCTMGRAHALGLPPDLDRLTELVGTPHQKDKVGAALMRKMAKPRRSSGDATLWWDDPADVARLSLYCDGDVYAEDDIDHRLAPLDPSEQELWVLDQRINDRGVYIDVPMVVRATELVAYAKSRADIEMARLTKGMVSKCTNVAKIMEWLNARGILCEHMRKGDQDDLIMTAEAYDDPIAVQVIELRRTASKTSLAKYDKMLEVVCADGCCRGLLGFHVARTGRWGGRLIQPQNLPRVDDETEGTIVAFIVALLTDYTMPISEVYDLIEWLGPPRSAIGEVQDGVSTLPWLSKALRSTIIAKPGHKLVGGDFSNIEGRVTAWLSGELWKLDAFRAYDNKTGPDLYILSYANSFGVMLATVTKPLRQIGKVQELALGFQGSIGAFFTMTLTYMVQLHKIVQAVRDAVSDDIWRAQADKYDGASNKAVFVKGFGKKEFMRHEWTALKLIVGKWRLAHPNTVQGWWDLQDAALQAVSEPGTIVPLYGGRAHYMSDGANLFCRLPSGRVITYVQPHIHLEVTEVIYDGKQYRDCSLMELEEIEALELAGYKVSRRERKGVRFWGVDSQKQWRVSSLYGGYQCENIVQATARCIMDRSMRRAEAAGYPLILTVHDELLSQPRIGFGSKEELKAIMSVTEPWMNGLPVSAAAWEDTRYVK